MRFDISSSLWDGVLGSGANRPDPPHPVMRAGPQVPVMDGAAGGSMMGVGAATLPNLPGLVESTQ